MVVIVEWSMGQARARAQPKRYVVTMCHTVGAVLVALLLVKMCVCDETYHYLSPVTEKLTKPGSDLVFCGYEHQYVPGPKPSGWFLDKHRRLRLSEFSDHICDIVQVQDTDGAECADTKACKYYGATLIDSEWMGRKYYFCNGYDAKREAGVVGVYDDVERHGVREVLRESRKFLGGDVNVIVFDGSNRLEPVFSLMMDEVTHVQLLIPSACVPDGAGFLNDIKGGSVRDHHTFTYTSKRSLADNCTLPFIIEMNEFMGGADARTRLQSVSPPVLCLQERTTGQKFTSGLLSFITDGASDVAAAKGPAGAAYESCSGKDYMKISRKYGVFKIKSPHFRVAVCVMDTAVEERTLKVIWRSVSYYERVIETFMNEVKTLLHEIVEPILRLIFQVTLRMVWEVMCVSFDVVISVLHRYPALMLLALTIAVFLPWYLYRRIRKLTRIDINRDTRFREEHTEKDIDERRFGLHDLPNTIFLKRRRNRNRRRNGAEW